MGSCEKCWSDAYGKMMDETYKSQIEAYLAWLKERKRNPCSPKEQISPWWHKEKQCDSRMWEA